MKTSHRIPVRRTKAGFTLAELLITIGILGVVSALGLRAYSTAIAYYGQARSEGESDKAVQAALQTMHDDVSSVLPTSLTGVSITGTVQNRAPDKIDSTIILPVSVPTFADNRDTAAWAKYSVQRIKGTARLVRTAVPLHQKIPENAGTDVVSGVVAFRVEYLDGEGRWLPEWSADASPIAVRVALTVRDPDSLLAPAITRSLVFRVPAQ